MDQPTDYRDILGEYKCPHEATYAKVKRMIDISAAANDAKSEREIALSTTFDEAMALQNAENLQAELDAIQAQHEEIKEALGLSQVSYKPNLALAVTTRIEMQAIEIRELRKMVAEKHETR